jgi:mono/diheme cytochrome c family protein
MLNGVGNSRTFKTKSRRSIALAAFAASTTWAAPAITAQIKPIEGEIVAGRDMALLACTGCHVVAPNQPFKPLYPGPPFPPDFKDIANRPSNSADSLQRYLDTLLAVPGDSHMPNLLLSSDEVRDVVAFIISLRDKPPVSTQ